MGLTVVTPPSALPVTLEEAKQELRILHADEDAKITRLIRSATAHVERMLGISLMERTLRLTLDAFTDTIELPMGPVSEVVSIGYIDAAGVEQIVSPSLYTTDLSSKSQWIVRNSDATWPATIDAVNAVTVTYTAGYEALPESLDDLKAAILTLVRHQFDDPAGNIPVLVDALLQPHRPMLV